MFIDLAYYFHGVKRGGRLRFFSQLTNAKLNLYTCDGSSSLL